jgi:hypothetical protein
MKLVDLKFCHKRRALLIASFLKQFSAAEVFPQTISQELGCDHGTPVFLMYVL